MLVICLTLIDDEEDKRSFEKLYYTYKGKAYAIAYDVLKNSALAEDACSEAFFSIARVYARIRHMEPKQLEKYVLLTIRNKALNLCRDEKKHRDVLPMNEEVVSLKDDVMSQYNAGLIRECIMNLSDTDREILYLRVTLGLEYQDIAQHLGISQAAARKRLEYARKKLSILLKGGE